MTTLKELRERLAKLKRGAAKPPTKPEPQPLIVEPRTDSVGMFLNTVILVFDSMRIDQQIVTECRKLLQSGATEQEVKETLDMGAISRSINELSLPPKFSKRHRRD